MLIIALAISLLFGFNLGSSDVEEMDNIDETENTDITAQTEGYRNGSISPYVKSNESRDMPAEITLPPSVIDIVKEVPVTAEVEKKVVSEFRVFENVMELERWLEENRLPIVATTNKSDYISLVNSDASDRYDCDDYAEDLQRKALQQGFLMSQQLVIDGRVYGVQVSTNPRGHMGNLAIAGDYIYYVNSTPPHKIVKIVSRD